jgi:hypothetical protein
MGSAVIEQVPGWASLVNIPPGRKIRRIAAMQPSHTP